MVAIHRPTLAYTHTHEKELTVITKTNDLDDLISRFSDSEFVAVDTEFIRETTYYPKIMSCPAIEWHRGMLY